MEELLEGLNCSLRVSGMVGDSIMVGIVNSAMEEAYERILTSKEGGLECLNDKSRFCGLAIMQLEWCLKYLQEEMDACVVKSDDERERLVGDLRMTRDRIRSRLEETESAIAEKEMELADMNQSELNLRRALESKDKELRSLRTSLELERARHGGVPEGTVLGNEAGEVMIEEVKVSLNELRAFIIQHIDDLSSKFMEAQTHMVGSIQKLSICHSTKLDTSETTQQNSDAEMFTHALMSDFDKLFKQLGLEMGVLKGRLVLAFEIADEAIYLSRAAMDEQQLLWTLERETLNVLIKTFLRDVEDSCHPTHTGELGDILSTSPNIYWTSLKKIVSSLNHNLEQLTVKLGRHVAGVNSTELRSLLDFQAEKNHESGELESNSRDATWLEAVGKRCPNFENPRELSSMKKHLTEVISEMEYFMEEINKMSVDFNGHQSANEMNARAFQDNLSRSEPTQKFSTIVCPSTTIHSNETTLRLVAADVDGDTGYCNESGEDSFLKSIILEKVNANIFEVSLKELYRECIEYNLDILLRDDVCKLIFNEAMKERNHSVDVCNLERILMEESVGNNAAGPGFKIHATENSSCFHHLFQGPHNDKDTAEVIDSLSMCVEVDLLSHSKSDIVEAQMILKWNADLVPDQRPTCTVSADVVDDDDDAFSSVKSELEKTLLELTSGRLQLRELGSDKGGSLKQKECAVVVDYDMGFSSKKMELNNESQQLDSNLQLTELTSDTLGNFEEEGYLDEKEDHDEYFSAVKNKLEKALQQLTKNKMQLKELELHMKESQDTLQMKECADDCNDTIDDDEAFSSVKSKLEMVLQQLTKNKVQLRDLELDLEGQLEGKANSNDDQEEEEKILSMAQSKSDICLNQLPEESMQLRDPGSDVRRSFEGNDCTCDNDDDQKQEDALSSVSSKLEMALLLLTEHNEQLRDMKSDMRGSLDGEVYEYDDDDERFISVRTKLERTLQQLTKNRVQLIELEPDTGESLQEKEDAVDSSEQDEEQPPCLQIKEGEEGCNKTQYVLRPSELPVEELSVEQEHAVEISEQDKEQALIVNRRNRGGCSEIQPAVALLTDFSRGILDLELIVSEKIKGSMLRQKMERTYAHLNFEIHRLEQLHCQLNLLVCQASSLKKSELLYRKAFTRRCYNLQTAESEVDLLGDEVDALSGLLEKIYAILDHYFPVLQYYYGIMHIRKLIEEKLFGGDVLRRDLQHT